MIASVRCRCQVGINDLVVRSLSLVNSGRVNFEYVWDLGPTQLLSVKPASGSVPRGERRVVEVAFAPTALDVLAGHAISCQVRCGWRNHSSRRPQLPMAHACGVQTASAPCSDVSQLPPACTAHPNLHRLSTARVTSWP